LHILSPGSANQTAPSGPRVIALALAIVVVCAIFPEGVIVHIVAFFLIVSYVVNHILPPGSAVMKWGSPIENGMEYSVIGPVLIPHEARQLTTATRRHRESIDFSFFMGSPALSSSVPSASLYFPQLLDTDIPPFALLI
jgi:hypothetical protein